MLDCTAEFASEQQQTTRECGDHRDAAAATQLLEHHCRRQNITPITMIMIKILSLTFLNVRNETHCPELFRIRRVS